MHIDSANLNNLIQLWQRYGTRPINQNIQHQLHQNISWPNRVWPDIEKPMLASSLDKVAKNIPDTTLFPLWPPIKKNGSVAPQEVVDTLVNQSRDWQMAFQHTAMAMQLNKQPPLNTRTEPQYPVKIKRIGLAHISDWVMTGSNAFGYSIDADVIRPLLAHENIRVLLAYNQACQPVATGLLFKTGNVVGIHQIGVPSEHRGKGYATQMMHLLIQSAKQWQASHVVLQASEAGRPVYQKLGFVDLFLITYLQKYNG